MRTLMLEATEAQDALVAKLQAEVGTLDGVAMTWQGNPYYVTHADGWHPRAEITVSLRDGGGFIAMASAPTYRPAWLPSFSVFTEGEGEDLAELMAALLVKVQGRWADAAAEQLRADKVQEG